MDLSVVLSAFSLLFLAEKGDKSQLFAMTLAHRYRAAAVIAGTFAAFAVLNLLAVLVGQAPSGACTGWRSGLTIQVRLDSTPSSQRIKRLAMTRSGQLPFLGLPFQEGRGWRGGG